MSGSAALAAAETGHGLDPVACRSLYRRFAASVTVVTSQGADGPAGLTASSVVPLSLRPPLLLACLAEGSRTLSAIETHRAFAVHLLRAGQRDRAAVFARSGGTPTAKFAGVTWMNVLGVPVLTGCLAWGVCFLEDTRTYGDHRTVVGRLVAAWPGTAGPLIWHDRDYRSLGPGPD